MSLDALAVVVFFLAVVEGALAGAAIVVGIRSARRGADPDEARRTLGTLLGTTLLVVAAVSVPLLVLLLASWVPRWPGIMCIAGVRRIGAAGIGLASWLPTLVATLDLTKLLVVFTAGTWAVLRAARARAGALALVVLGAIALLDAGTLGAYVVIPKEEIPPAAGCCIQMQTAASREVDVGRVAPEDAARGPRLAAAFVIATAALGGLALFAARRGAPGRVAPAAVAFGSAASLPLGASFLTEFVSPRVLELPFHRCAWCAFAGAPETVVGALLFLGATCCAGWALVARLTGVTDRAKRLLLLASFGFLASAAMGTALWVMG